MLLRTLFLASLVLGLPNIAHAFCGFYVGQAGTELFNDASKAVLVRDGDKTTITMANDFAGNVADFAMVVPVPNVPKRDDIRLAESRLIDHLDRYTAPRLVEYFDDDPCRPKPQFRMAMAAMAVEDSVAAPASGPDALGVKIEAEYSVGEYDIVILSAEQSSGLQRWLSLNGYQVPAKAQQVLADYISGGMKFFVARVSLDRIVQGPDGEATYLNPLQITMTSPELMLPIRLGMVNARGDQELFVFAITRTGRVEAVNYANRRLPSDVNIPPFAELLFGRFYQDLFSRQLAQTTQPTIFTEYAWDMAWCDPCAANPPSAADLAALGVDWLGVKPSGTRGSADTGIAPQPSPQLVRPGPTLVPAPAPTLAVDAFVTRMHVRYNAQSYKQDIRFRVTEDRENYQGRYVMQHPFTGEIACDAGQSYLSNLTVRQAQERGALNALTGWPLDYIAQQQARYAGKPNDGTR